MSQFETKRFIIMTVDPVHIGTGGMRLGRVDNSIVREPGTNLPKIPGSALHGAIRQYAAYLYGKRQCAGQGQSKDGGSQHCGKSTCPICYTFGSITGERAEQSHSGVVSIADAQILLFPVYSMVGPVWITSPSIISEVFKESSVPEIKNGQAVWGDVTPKNYLNLGWLMVEKMNSNWLLPSGLAKRIPELVKKRIVLVSDELLSQVINSNLEVRTSVSINPETGAAEEGALFTYEAIPRGTFLWFDVVVDDYRREGFPLTSKKYNEENGMDNAGDKLGVTWEEPSAVIESGLDWAEHLGIGGMGTRGFGRIRKINVTNL